MLSKAKTSRVAAAPMRWLARRTTGRRNLLRRSLGVKRWGARARVVALRERSRLLDQMAVLASRQRQAADRPAGPRLPISPSLLKEAVRKNNTITARGAEQFRAARPAHPDRWIATLDSTLDARGIAPAHREPAALSMAGQALHVDCAAAAGAVGSLFSEANEVELAFLMRLIAEGDTATASRIAKRILDARRVPEKAASVPAGKKLQVPQPQAEALTLVKPRRVRNAQPPSPERARSSLSPRELKVLRMVSQGLSNRQIAESSYRSLHTVDAQVKNIYRKLAVKSRAQAVREGIRMGLLDPEGRG
ncbi:response regulator transcription factor [Variovorax sp. E3]|uniref:helix-turn-helix transcriptional regulator n=1 Tax=Variovorax sp. E3 TaxID=1914993 RepID=UPI0018DE50B1|nr:response regulator transcription factor [Variovorax sp. E3]